jgi:predicted SprT family Zn-dependent metalloprotease
MTQWSGDPSGSFLEGRKWRVLPHRRTAPMARKNSNTRPPQPPARGDLPLVHASGDVSHWLAHYWQKLRLPDDQRHFLAVTQDRGEFAAWAGRRLNSFALGCYCYLPLPGEADEDRILDYEAAASATLTAPTIAPDRAQLRLPFIEDLDAADETLSELAGVVEARDLSCDYRHLIFVEPGMSDLGIEVTVAHELIHLSDRVQGRPRKHHCHGYDSISVDEAAITGRDPELLRAQLREETERREDALRRARPYRYVYSCPECDKEYPRVRRYSRAISCGHCDGRFNPAFELIERQLAAGETYQPRAGQTQQQRGAGEHPRD